jgi:hypothetical protein
VVQADQIVVNEVPSPAPVSLDQERAAHVDSAVLSAHPESEIINNRQKIIYQLISDEVQYHKILDVIESVRFPTLRLAGRILPLTAFPRK